jgi:hypothetical protein
MAGSTAPITLPASGAEAQRLRAGLQGQFARLVQARADMVEQRHKAPNHPDPLVHAALVNALEAYVGAIASLGYPVPYALATELNFFKRRH